MDEDGFIYFKQRLKRVIISSGYNIYPKNIENIIDKHPSVFLSAVIGIDHEYKKQVAKAFIILKDGIEESEELKQDIYNHCKQNLAKYSLPYEIEFRKEFPRTLVGKIAYVKLEEEERVKTNESKNITN